MIARVIRRFLEKKDLIPVTIYHVCTNESDNDVFRANVHNVVPSFFEQHIRQIKKKYAIVSMEELTDIVHARKKVRKVAAITFDDGYRSVITEAAAILRSHQVPFTFFINGKLVSEKTFWRDKVRFLINSGNATRFVDENTKGRYSFDAATFYKGSKSSLVNSRIMEELMDKYLEENKLHVPVENLYSDWTDLSAAKSEYISFGNHSYSHYVLSSLNAQEQHQEILRNRALIQSKLQKESSVFSIPFGGPGTYNDDTLKILADLGYKGYVLSGSLRQCAPPTIDRFGLVRINRFMPMNEPVIKGL